MLTALAWLLYALAAFGAVAAMGLAIVGRKTLDFLDGHLGIGVGFALTFVSAGFLIDHLQRLTVGTVVACLAGMSCGGALWFFSRRRARDVSRFLIAVKKAKARHDGADVT